jgi:hypothetical protein
MVLPKWVNVKDRKAEWTRKRKQRASIHSTFDSCSSFSSVAVVVGASTKPNCDELEDMCSSSFSSSAPSVPSSSSASRAVKKLKTNNIESVSSASSSFSSSSFSSSVLTCAQKNKTKQNLETNQLDYMCSASSTPSTSNFSSKSISYFLNPSTPVCVSADEDSNSCGDNKVFTSNLLFFLFYSDLLVLFGVLICAVFFLSGTSV